MNLLARALPNPRHLLRPGGLFSLYVLSFVLLLEVAGRQTTSDVHDVIAAFFLCFVVLTVAVRHRREPLAWVAALTAFAVRVGGGLVERFRFEVGVDLRGRPPVRRGLPPLFLALAAGLAVWGGAAAAWWHFVPQGLRPIGVVGWYVGYLAGMMLLWVAMIGCVAVGSYLVVNLIRDAAAGAFAADRPRRRFELAAFVGYFGGLLLAGALLPLGMALALGGALLAAAAVILLARSPGEVQFLWRRGPGSPARAIPWARGVFGTLLLITLLLTDLVLTACGGKVFGSADTREAMPITTAVGTFLGWLAPGVLGVLVAHVALGRLRDPARPARPAAHVRGAAGAAVRRRVCRAFARRGWRVRFAPAAVRPDEVCVALVPAGQSEAGEFEPVWPLKLSVEDLEAGAVFERLLRRDEIQQRRRVMAALRRLFKLAGRRTYPGGHGFWVAPHFWFVPGLTRDESDEEAERGDGSLLTRTIGPSYHALMGRPARHHLYRVLRAAQVDLIFVEDGVGFRKLARVLRALFEVYDKGAGQRRAEEVHFRGLTGLRVLIHDFQYDHPFRSESYPEPRFEEFSRARVLHVFRDRGEDEERVEPPADFSSSPAPVLVG